MFIVALISLYLLSYYNKAQRIWPKANVGSYGVVNPLKEFHIINRRTSQFKSK